MKKHQSAALKILKGTPSFQTSKRSLAVCAACISLVLGLSAHANAYHEDNSTVQTGGQTQMNTKPTLATLTNFQKNAPFMYSSGLPDASHLSLLKEEGVTHVIDLIPGNRTSEILTTSELGLDYFNVPVDWEGPTLANFLNYAAFMQSVDIEKDKVLTHCKLNWRGAAFTYLYRINVLGESEQAAKKDLMAIWHPNPTWYAFMNDVISHYNEVNGKQVAMSFEAAAPESH
ncbi:hypothetical protein BK026_10145 [Alteromonas sp. V450]|uniref:hypothetical protein n=1 Tax=Alteromonas sp. V450 TaxID=1912139 RepID=UPI0008FF69DF|nr:hypothetical protein [Alteromonas sp. V450]OJF69129.1 hypothetical protein BK026_10145 [Alteromonas sp. V450]